MTVRSARDLEYIPYHLTLPYANLYTPKVIGFRVTWFGHGLFTSSAHPEWVTKTVSSSLEILYLRFCDPVEILQAKVKRFFFTGPRARSRAP